MQAMLRLVAIVALMASARANLLEYSGEVETWFNEENQPKADAITNTNLDNVDVAVEFEVSREPSDEGIYLHAVSPYEGEDCTGRFSLTQAQTHCNLVYILFGIEVYAMHPTGSMETPENEKLDELEGTDQTNEDDEEGLRIAMYFKDDGKPFLLDIPVYTLPAEVAALDEEAQKDWATEKRVSLASPINAALLEEIRSLKKPISVSFSGWLQELLELGIYEMGVTFETKDKNNKKVQIAAFVSRPVVLPPDLAKLFYDVTKELMIPLPEGYDWDDEDDFEDSAEEAEEL